MMITDTKRHSLKKPRCFSHPVLDKIMVCVFHGWVRRQSHAGLEQQMNGHAKKETKSQFHKMGIRHKYDFLWDTDTASGFAYSNGEINLPKLFSPFASSFTTLQIHSSWYIRNKSASAPGCTWGFCVHSPQGCPNTSQYDTAASLVEASLSCTAWRSLSCTTV